MTNGSTIDNTFANRRFADMTEERAKLLDRLALLQAKLATAKAPDRPIIQSKIMLLQSEIREKELAISRFLDYNGPVGRLVKHRNLRPVADHMKDESDKKEGDGNDDIA